MPKSYPTHARAVGYLNIPRKRVQRLEKHPWCDQIHAKNVDKSEPIFFSVAYKPPDVTVANNACFINHLKLHSGEYNSKIVMGDFNINLLLKSNNATYLRDATSELALKVVNHGPTHFRTTPGTWIDAIFVGYSDTITDTENEPASYHNHHNLIGDTIDIYIPKAPCESFLTGSLIRLIALKIKHAIERL